MKLILVSAFASKANCDDHIQRRSQQGNVPKVNLYTVDYTVKGTDLKLTGDETWQGTVANADEMSGTWTAAKQAA
jgi:hypothetical protein